MLQHYALHRSKNEFRSETQNIHCSTDFVHITPINLCIMSYRWKGFAKTLFLKDYGLKMCYNLSVSIPHETILMFGTSYMSLKSR